MTKRIGLLIGISMLALLAMLLWRADSVESRAGYATYDQSVASEHQVADDSLRDEVRRMQSELRELRRTLAKEPSTPRPVDDSPASSAPPDRETALREFADWRAQAEHELGEHLAAEPVDLSWNAAVELQAKIAAALPVGSTVNNIDCRTSMCRVETTHADVERYRQYQDHFIVSPERGPEDVLWQGAGTQWLVLNDPAATGEYVSAVFLVRQNYTLPKPPALPPSARAAR